MPPTPRGSPRCLQEEILVAPCLEARVVGRRRARRRRLERGVEVARVVGVGEHRRQIGAAAEPGLGRDDVARVHVHRRHQRRAQMRHQRDAARPEARILGGAGDLAAELGLELAVHGRDIDADLLEDAAVHHRHRRRRRRRRASQGWRCEAAGGAVRWPLRRVFVLDRLEGGADAVAQRLEPVGRALLRRLVGTASSVMLAPSEIARSGAAPRPAPCAAASATLSERTPGRIGTRKRLGRLCTASGTPALSRPEQQRVVGAEGEAMIGASARRRQQDQPRPRGTARNAAQEACRVSVASAR